MHFNLQQEQNIDWCTGRTVRTKFWINKIIIKYKDNNKDDTKE